MLRGAPPYLLLALWWWPAAPVAAGIAMVALRRGRAGMDVFAELVETVVDLHGGDLAARPNADTPDALLPETGARRPHHPPPAQRRVTWSHPPGAGPTAGCPLPVSPRKHT